APFLRRVMIACQQMSSPVRFVEIIVEDQLLRCVPRGSEPPCRQRLKIIEHATDSSTIPDGCPSRSTSYGSSMANVVERLALEVFEAAVKEQGAFGDRAAQARAP